jgi:hypothetical protein
MFVVCRRRRATKKKMWIPGYVISLACVVLTHDKVPLPGKTLPCGLCHVFFNLCRASETHEKVPLSRSAHGQLWPCDLAMRPGDLVTRR